VGGRYLPDLGCPPAREMGKKAVIVSVSTGTLLYRYSNFQGQGHVRKHLGMIMRNR
jgi:hypothetical protein